MLDSPSFLPFNPQRLLMLSLMGFFSLPSCPALMPSILAIFASISAFFFRISSACSDIASSRFPFTSPGLKVLLHMLIISHL